MPLKPALDDLIEVMCRLHTGRGIAGTVTMLTDLTVRCDAQDLDEALGNLIENAWRHAHSQVAITAEGDGRTTRIRIADDGAALDDDALAALRAGTIRLDERADGHGQGIRIARELIELYGGSLAYERSALGGLLAAVELPAAPPRAA